MTALNFQKIYSLVGGLFEKMLLTGVMHIRKVKFRALWEYLARGSGKTSVKKLFLT